MNDSSAEPRNPLAKFAFDVVSKNSCDNSVVVIYECHNLVKKCKFRTQMARLRCHLRAASNITLAAFTGTPVLDEENMNQKRDELMGVIRGRPAETLRPLRCVAWCLGVGTRCH